MERSPLISWVFHLRAVTLLLILGGLDYLFIRSAWYSVTSRGLSVEIVFGLEVSWLECRYTLPVYVVVASMVTNGEGVEYSVTMSVGCPCVEQRHTAN